MFQEEAAILRESVPRVNLYQYSQTYLYSNLNGYGDKEARAMWPSRGFAYFTSLTWFVMRALRRFVHEPTAQRSCYVKCLEP